MNAVYLIAGSGRQETGVLAAGELALSGTHANICYTCCKEYLGLWVMYRYILPLYLVLVRIAQ